jgi:hypothetical protein
MHIRQQGPEASRRAKSIHPLRKGISFYSRVHKRARACAATAAPWKFAGSHCAQE